MINAILAYVSTFFGQAKNHVGQVRIVNHLPGMAN